MSNNENLRTNGEITKFDLMPSRRSKYVKQTIKLFNKTLGTSVKNRGIWDDDKVVVVLQDTHNKGEERNKRIQGTLIKDSSINEYALIGLYGVKDEKGNVK